MVEDCSKTKMVAKAFTDARLNAVGLAEYPGSPPESIEHAYNIQDAAIDVWLQPIGGWKIGGIGSQYAEQVGTTKLVGPVFENQIYKSGGEEVMMPVFKDGFAAIEPEIVFIVADDAPVDKVDWTLEEAESLVETAHIGVEIASSPFPGINDNGPLVTISDFGNNNGLIVGEELPNWKDSSLNDWVVETFIDGQSKGATTPPGPLESFQFLLRNAALRGRSLKKGMAITTGAITGVHQAYCGQSSIIRCSKVADIRLKLVSAISI